MAYLNFKINNNFNYKHKMKLNLYRQFSLLKARLSQDFANYKIQQDCLIVTYVYYYTDNYTLNYSFTSSAQ
jgi:hypothetical protein